MANNATFIGRLGADAEVRQTNNGTPVANLRVASDIGFGQNKRTQWLDVSYFGKGAQAAAPYLTKGREVVIAGEVEMVEFERKDGTNGAKLAINARDVTLVGGRGDDQPASGAGGASSGGSAYAGASNGGGNVSDDEIPF